MEKNREEKLNSSQTKDEFTASQNYSLRRCVHNLQLPDQPNHLADSNLSCRCYSETCINIVVSL